MNECRQLKRNNDDNDNNDQKSKPPTVVAKLLNFKDKQDILHEAKSHKARIFFKEHFSREALKIRKGLE